MNNLANKPKFNIFKNIKYAIDGMKEVLKTESSFKIQLFVISFLTIIIVFLSFSIASKMILIISMFLVLLTEAINSAIERVVDLVTHEYHPLAKQAKDIGSFCVFISFLIVLSVFACVFYLEVF